MRDNPPMIEDKILEKSDIGKEVWYIPSQAKNDFSKWEKGILSSFICNHEGVSVFVKFRGVTGERINPNNLKFVRK